MKRITLALLPLVTWNASALAQSCEWGSFDASRINYAAGTLGTGSAHDDLRASITAGSGTLATETPTLTAAYLAGIDVFYTSLLNTVTGTLSAAEQTALQNWIATGGTLIVTGDIFPLPAYESITSFYGVTNWTAISNVGTGNVVASHLVTQGVTAYEFVTNGGFTYGGDAMLLGDDGAGNDFMIVMEPATGFTAGGRILVLGDHNMFTDDYISQQDNTLLANNMVTWACGGGALYATLCFGDGSGASCGCGNEVPPGTTAGCLNGLGVGAVLGATGVADTTADTVAFTASDITDQPGLFFQGDSFIGGGAGVGFGDGLRCCGQNVIRLEIVDPAPTTLPTTATTTVIVSQHPAQVGLPGTTRCYQYWYRNPGSSPCGSNFNLSNAVSVTWS